MTAFLFTRSYISLPAISGACSDVIAPNNYLGRKLGELNSFAITTTIRGLKKLQNSSLIGSRYFVTPMKAHQNDRNSKPKRAGGPKPRNMSRHEVVSSATCISQKMENFKGS